MRDAAQRYLMKQTPPERETVERLLIKTGDPEVIGRLSAIAVHLYLKGETPFEGSAGMLGVSLSAEVSETDKDTPFYIAITDISPGFPAAEVLQVGDRIFALDGARFTEDMNITAFRTAVMANKPGSSVVLSIDRAGVKKDVRVKLDGVPDQGTAALMEFVQQRNDKAEVYKQRLLQLRGGLSMAAPATNSPLRGPRIVPLNPQVLVPQQGLQFQIVPDLQVAPPGD